MENRTRSSKVEGLFMKKLVDQMRPYWHNLKPLAPFPFLGFISKFEVDGQKNTKPEYKSRKRSELFLNSTMIYEEANAGNTSEFKSELSYNLFLISSVLCFQSLMR